MALGGKEKKLPTWWWKGAAVLAIALVLLLLQNGTLLERMTTSSSASSSSTSSNPYHKRTALEGWLTSFSFLEGEKGEGDSQPPNSLELFGFGNETSTSRRGKVALERPQLFPLSVWEDRTTLLGEGSEEVVLLLCWHSMRTPGGLKLTNLYPINSCSDDRAAVKHNKTDLPLCPDIDVPNCPVKCRWSHRRELRSVANVIVLQPEETRDGRLPREKNQDQMWAAFGHEPTWKRPWVLPNASSLGFFDVSYHWGANADVQLRFFYFDEMDGEDTEWWKSLDPRAYWANTFVNGNALTEEALQSTELLKRDNTTLNRTMESEETVAKALASVVVSSCTEARRKWVERFMSMFPTASYGLCLKNAVGDKRMLRQNGTELKEAPSAEARWDLMQQKLELLKRHPFYLAIESDLEAGFVTEKVFQALQAGSVPIYLGSREVWKMVPPNSIIYAGDFKDLESLVEYVRGLASNFEAYLEYHAWRKESITKAIFEKLKAEGRTTAPCRLCQFYHENYRNRMVMRETQPRWDRRTGWSRGSRDAEARALIESTLGKL